MTMRWTYCNECWHSHLNDDARLMRLSSTLMWSNIFFEILIFLVSSKGLHILWISKNFNRLLKLCDKYDLQTANLTNLNWLIDWLNYWRRYWVLKQCWNNFCKISYSIQRIDIGVSWFEFQKTMQGFMTLWGKYDLKWFSTRDFSGW